MKLCRCGCGKPVSEARVFVDKRHQIAWLRAQATPGDGQPEAHGPRSEWTFTLRGLQEFPWYSVGFWITSFVAFVSTWIYCIAAYGFLIGVGLGWLPSFIVAIIAGAAWPVLLFIVIGLLS